MQLNASALWKRQYCKMRFDSCTKYHSMRGELYHFSGERKRFTQFIRALLERIHTFAAVWEKEIFVEQRILSLFSLAQTSSIFHAYATNGSGPIARSPLAVRRKQKSKLGRSEYTRIPRLPMEFNICCLRYETRALCFFSPFSTLSPAPAPAPSLFILCARFSMWSRYPAERHDLCLKYTIEPNKLKKASNRIKFFHRVYIAVTRMHRSLIWSFLISVELYLHIRANNIYETKLVAICFLRIFL